jgi:predicted aconitase with swiveling domain
MGRSSSTEDKPMAQRVIRGHKGIGEPVRGIALVAADNFSARYDLDREQGVFSRPAHRLYGQSYVGRILVLNAAKGGVATSWMLAEMAARRRAPLALLLNFANPIMAQAAAFSGIPLIDRFEEDITRAVRTGQELQLDPAAGLVSWRS